MRRKVASVLLAGLPFWALWRPFEFQVLSVIRKSGSRFSREIALQPLYDQKKSYEPS